MTNEDHKYDGILNWLHRRNEAAVVWQNKRRMRTRVLAEHWAGI